ncbi:AmmeMemoRadiSam system protein B [Thermodesulfobacterium sp. TA1]|uniref:AmmeMemoRadiSam system protein B n=1 Tax=Thermodesulfobacterium sp. TA1 TaxID=2234087 RepID=UPI00143CFB7B|nr:AmmeMemoRadiSam system protein B [Thermodesulfobacterium sp. TA1]
MELEYPLDYKPILRYVDVIPAEHEGQPVFFLRDPLGFIDELVVVPQYLAFLLALMNGQNDLRDLQSEATKQFGQMVPLEEVVKIVKFLDEKGLLWSKTFEEIKEKAYSKWFSYPFRAMAHANSAYPLSAAEAKFFVEDILKLGSSESANPPKILIAPHIDIKAAARSYAESYNRFKLPPGARIIILGVGHHLDLPFSVLTKDIATPFGLIKNDRGGLFFLTNSKKIEVFPDHIAHRLEHSIEFQALFLHYLLKDQFMVLPVLVGPMPTLFENPELTNRFVEGLAQLMEDEHTYLVLGIDFCHLGLRYGDPFEVSEEHAQIALENDKALLQLTFDGTKEEFLEKAKQTLPLKVCGLSTLYLTKLIMEKLGAKGKLDLYHQEFVPFGQGSAVSVSSAGYVV